MMDYGRFKVLTFDCYGTLIDWETGIVSAIAPMITEAGVKVQGETLLEAYGALETEIEKGDYVSYREVLRRVLLGLGDRFGFSPSKSGLDDFSSSVKNWPAFEDSPDALRSLKNKFKLAILSNIDRDLIGHSIKKLGVEFDYVFTAQDIGSYKPARRNFEYALENLREAPERVLHVAQSLFHDIGPAREVGLHTVWINRRHGKSGTGATPPSHARPHAEFQDLQSFGLAACG